ncbi:MAG: hypothetical protein KME30_24895 [Iphinoe sp. HA4291-MV1]|jgi:hypothetical protein|nr:hypothetical protein [Iphinoe sp. HA4291-MV1]
MFNIEPKLQRNNPRITPVLQIVTGAEVFILSVAGVVLFCLPELSRYRWVWQITPFNSHFLGAVYLTALVPTVMLVVVRRRKAARMVLPMQLTFTTILLLVSLLYLENFNFQRRITWGWFLLYTIIPLTSAYHLWLYRRLPPIESTFVSPRWRFFLRVQGILLTLYGVGLLLVPSTFTAFWLWKVDNFHSQMYSSVFLTLAIGAFLLSRVALYLELFTLGLTELVLGLLEILGVAIADAKLHKVNWFIPGTWLWISIFAILFISGVAMIWQSCKRNNSNEQ